MVATVQTRLGRLSIPADRVITFPEGLIGFENRKRFALVEQSTNSPFRWLVSLEDPNLAFVVVAPIEFMAEYKVELPPTAMEKLQLSEDQEEQPEPEIVVLAVITVPRNPAEMTANLIGPIVIHAGRRVGYQLIVDQAGYSSRHPVLEEIRQNSRRHAGIPALAVSATCVSA